MASLIPSEKQNESHAQAKQEKSISMHEDIPVWYDCCSCEAEPYWLEAMAQIETENAKQDK
jgi:hypothetical protein